MAPRRRFIRRGKRNHYSVENRFFSLALTGGQTTTQVIVPSSSTEGKRKVAHLTISGTYAGGAAGIMWALMYIPQGFTVPGFNLGSTGSSILEPNQYVMNAGTLDADAGPIRISSRVTRILHSGDSIVLLVVPLAPTTTLGAVNGLVRYAIAYN